MGYPIQQGPAQYYRPIQQQPVQQQPVQQQPVQQRPVQQLPTQWSPTQQSPGQVGQHPGQQGYATQNNAAAGALIGGLIGIGIGAFFGIAASSLQVACRPNHGGYPGQGPGQGPGQTPGQYPGQTPGQVGQTGPVWQY